MSILFPTKTSFAFGQLFDSSGYHFLIAFSNEFGLSIEKTIKKQSASLIK